MLVILQILTGLIALICLLGGLNLLIKGSTAFLPENTPPLPILDNLFRFLSGIYFGLAFLLAWVTLHMEQQGNLIYYIAIVVIFSGLGRFYSRLKVGSAGKYFDFIMVFEIVLGLVMILLQSMK